MINIKKLLLFFCLFFLFNTLEIDSNNTKILLYDRNNIDFEDYFKIYFNNTNTNELKEVLPNYNIRILSYIIDDKKYYARNIDELVSIYTRSKSLEEKIYYDNYGIKVDGINAMCEARELIKLEKVIHFY